MDLFHWQAEKQIQCQLFRLYYIEKDIQRLMNEIKEKQEEVAVVEKNKEQADEVLKDMKKEAGKRSRELAELEQKIRVVVSGSKPDYCVCRGKLSGLLNKPFTIFLGI